MPGCYPGDSSAGLVMAKDDEAWSIVALRNRIPFERPMADPLEHAMMEGAKPP